MDSIEFNNYLNWKSEIYDDDEKILFDEIVKCIENGAYRSSSVMIWVLCAESLYKKLRGLSESDTNLKNNLNNIFSENNKNEKELLNLSKKYYLIDNVEYHQLNAVREARNHFAHPNYEEPSKNEILSYLFFVVKNVLSKTPMHSYKYVKNLIEICLKDPYSLGNKNENQIKQYVLDLINRMDPRFLKSLLDFLFEQTEKLFGDIDIHNQKCFNIGLIFIKTFILEDTSLLSQINDFLLNYQRTSCFIFSDEELWEILDDDSKYRIFNYSFNFENNIFSEIEFLNRFSLLYELNLLDDEFKEKIETFINDSTAEIVFNSNIPKDLLFNKIILDLNDNDFDVQNPIARQIKSLELDIFDDSQLEKLGRILFRSANRNAFDSKNTISYYLKNLDIVPIPFIKGILFEIFVNEDNEFYYKRNFSNTVLKTLLNNDSFDLIFEDLLELIENSNINMNNFDNYDFSIKKLNSLKEEYIILNKIESLIKSIEKSRCNVINKVFEKENYFLLDISNYNKEDIWPYLNCFNGENKEKFLNISNDDVFKFIEFFSTIVTSINKREITSIVIHTEFLGQFVELEELRIIVEENLNENLDYREKILGKYFLDNFS